MNVDESMLPPQPRDIRDEGLSDGPTLVANTLVPEFGALLSVNVSAVLQFVTMAGQLVKNSHGVALVNPLKSALLMYSPSPPPLPPRKILPVLNAAFKKVNPLKMQRVPTAF